MQFIQHKRFQKDHEVDISKMFFLPYLRIVPMHLMILGPAFLGWEPSTIFLVLKTVADLIMYLITVPHEKGRRTLFRTLRKNWGSSACGAPWRGANDYSKIIGIPEFAPWRGAMIKYIFPITSSFDFIIAPLQGAFSQLLFSSIIICTPSGCCGGLKLQQGLIF